MIISTFVHFQSKKCSKNTAKELIIITPTGTHKESLWNQEGRAIRPHTGGTKGLQNNDFNNKR